MDTESLLQRLKNFRTVLEQILHQENSSHSSDQKNAQAESSQQAGRLLKQFQDILLNDAAARDAAAAPENPLFAALNAHLGLLDESCQQIILLQEILQNSPVGLAVVTGPDMIFRLANRTYCDLLPNARAEITGLPYRQVWSEETGFEGDRLIRQMLNGRKNMDFERLDLRYPDGLIRNFMMRACHLTWHNEPGALILVQETTQADRARLLAIETAEEARRHASELDAIIMAMAEAVTIFNFDGLSIRANPVAVDLFGIDPVGVHLNELIDLLSMRHPNGEPINLNDLPAQRALQGEVVVGQHLLLVDNEGSERDVLASASPLFDETGVSAIVTVWHDVTERERLLEQLEIEQSRLETIIRNAPEAILVADEEGRLVLGNPAAERIFGRAIPYDQELGSHAGLSICYNDGSPYDPRNLPLTCSALDGELLNNIELLVTLPDGQIRNILASTAPIVDHKGNLNGAVGVFQDNTRHKQAEEELRRQASRAQELQALHRATMALLSTIDVETLLDQILDAAQQAIPVAEQGILYLHSTDTRLEVRVATGYRARQLSSVLQIHASRVIEQKRPLILDAFSDHTPGGSEPGSTGSMPAESGQPGSAIIAPLNSGQSVLGALALIGPHPKLFTENDLELLNNFAATATLALQNATLYAEVQRLATTDTLTEQFNRRRFFELGELEMHRSRRFHHTLSAIMLDLDNFKEINDTYGHRAGDQVLHAVAQRCRDSIRVVDILGRYGGDEFAILLPGADLHEAREIAERIRQMVITKPVDTDRGEVHVSISLGITQSEQDVENLSALLGRADTALYNAKQGGRNRVMQD